MRYISHLDLQRLLNRALRRARLPISISQGFSPHPKISFKRALKLGVESDNEEFSVALKETLDISLFKEKLQKELPDGMTIMEATHTDGK